MWNFGPILATLSRHKTTAALLVLTAAITCALVSNALHLTGLRLSSLLAPTTSPEKEVLVLQVNSLGQPGELQAATTQRDLEALRALPGVAAVSQINQVVYGGSNWGMGGLTAKPGDDSDVYVSQYIGHAGFLSAMGLRLKGGREFTDDEFVSYAASSKDYSKLPKVMILNEDAAQRLFPGENAVGKTIYMMGKLPITVVGVAQGFTPSNPKSRKPGDQLAILMPVRPDYPMGYYVLRTQPGQRDAVRKLIEPTILGIDTRREVRNLKGLDEMHREYDRDDRQMAWLMAGVIAALLAVTGAGIVGLASFWVQQRHRMIGTRRALGATRGDILRYFLTENFLLTTGGIALGMLGAYGLSVVLMRHWALPALPWFYLPLGALVLWGLGLLAVLAPAWRAANLPPVAALRGG